MLISLLLIVISAVGGLSITYLIDDDAPLMWRLAAGSIIGCAIFGSVGFLLCLIFGLTAVVVTVSLALAAAPVLLFGEATRRNMLWHDWARAKGKLQGGNARKLLRVIYYALFFLLFFFFFDRAMLETSAGIFTGGSQNLGDLPFHLGAIFSFTEANNFPPVNPSYADARFSYPFVADLLTAFAVKLGASVRDAMFVQNVSWAFALLIVLERFVFRLTNDKLAARIAPALLFFSGGLGFIWAFGDYSSQAKGFFDFLAHLPKDYTIGEGFRWGNSMVVLFMTQRSLLLGMPLTLIILTCLWKFFATEQPENDKNVSPSPHLHFSLSPVLLGLLAGLLPLIHLHSLAVLFIVGVFLFILRPERWMTWILFAVGVGVIAVPELIWSMAGSANETSKFFAWHFGWDKGERNFFLFWLLNTGLVIPALIAGLYLASLRNDPEGDADIAHTRKKKKDKKTNIDAQDSPLTIHHSPLIFFYLAFAFLFVVSNAAKLAPWEWDNIKVLIYWFVGSIPLIAIVIAWLWRKDSAGLKVAAAVLLVALTLSGALDVWRVVSSQVNYKVFDKDAVELAHQINLRTPAHARFLNAPTYNTAVVLTGRQSLMRYPGHLSSHGIDYAARESDVKKIYQGGPEADALMKKYDIAYVVVSPEERTLGNVNEQYFAKFPVAAEAGQSRAYKVRTETQP
jgi:hypothetical protein